MNGEPDDDGPERELLRHAAAEVLAGVESWLGEGLGTDAALALVQNALPLSEEAGALPRLQRRSHGTVLAALLLLMADERAADLATRLVEGLREGAVPRVLVV